VCHWILPLSTGRLPVSPGSGRPQGRPRIATGITRHAAGKNKQGPGERLTPLDPGPCRTRHRPIYLATYGGNHRMTATGTATSPKHRKDGPAKTGHRITPGLHQGDKTGATR